MDVRASLHAPRLKKNFLDSKNSIKIERPRKHWKKVKNRPFFDMEYLDYHSYTQQYESSVSLFSFPATFQHFQTNWSFNVFRLFSCNFPTFQTGAQSDFWALISETIFVRNSTVYMQQDSHADTRPKPYSNHIVLNHHLIQIHLLLYFRRETKWKKKVK